LTNQNLPIMLRPILPLLAIISTLSLFAQNLVPNPSFEEYENGCPANFHEMPLGWQWWSGSPNSYNSCIEPVSETDSLGWVPINGIGIQHPADGNSYIGLTALGADCCPNEYKETIGIELSAPLQVGEEYFLSFKTSWAEGGGLLR